MTAGRLMTGPEPRHGLDEAFVWDVGDAVVDLAWSRRGALSALTAAGRVCVIDGPTSSVRDIGGRLSQAWDQTGARLAVAGLDKVHVFSHLDGSLPAPLASPQSSRAGSVPRPSGWIMIDRPRGWGARLAWSPTGLLAASCEDSVTLHAIAADLAARTTTSQPAQLPGTVMDLAWLDTRRLGAATLTGTWLLDLPSAQRAPLGDELDASLSLAVSRTGILAVGRAAGSVALHDGRGDAVDLDGYADPRWTVAWSGIGSSVVTSEEDRLVLWKVEGLDARPERPTVLRGHRAAVCCVAVAAGSGLLASADVEGTILVWAPEVSEQPIARRVTGVAVHCCAWAPHGDLLAIGTDGGVSALTLAFGPGPAARTLDDDDGVS